MIKRNIMLKKWATPSSPSSTVAIRNRDPRPRAGRLPGAVNKWMVVRDDGDCRQGWTVQQEDAACNFSYYSTIFIHLG